MKSSTGIIVTVIAVLAVTGFFGGFIPGFPYEWSKIFAPAPATGTQAVYVPTPMIPSAPQQAPIQPTTTGGIVVNAQLVSLSAKVADKLNGSTISTNAEVWDAGDEQFVVETNINGLTSLSTSMPNTFSGKIYYGNDDFQSSTDRGTEYYYGTYPISWTNIAGLKPYNDLFAYAEDTGTDTTLWTFIDVATDESETPNITIAEGGSYSAAYVKLKSQNNMAVGNPEFNGQKPLGYCFNESTSGMFKEIKPLLNDGTIDTPGFLKGKNIVGCYALPTNALIDGSYFTTDLYYEANGGQNPGVSDSSCIMPIDKAYYKTDPITNGVTKQKWAAGYGDESDIAADTDVGIDSIAAALKVNFA